MHAFFLIGNDSTVIDNKIEELLNRLDSTRVDFIIQKIADLKEFKSFTKINLDRKTTIVIHNFGSATIETQNGFLKSLEEPQEKLSFILISNSLEGVLPTILSRCEVIEINSNSNIQIDTNTEKTITEFLDSQVGNRLSFISKIKDRQEAIEFISNVLIIGKKRLEKEPQIWELLDYANKTLKALKQNGNVQLQLTNFVINVS
jgi:hypothetical protein